jgi:hypothetical protein
LVRTVRQTGGVNSESLIHAELNRAELLLHEAAWSLSSDEQARHIDRVGDVRNRVGGHHRLRDP